MRAALLKKNDADTDHIEIVRAAVDVRTLGLKNSDNQIIYTTSNRAWKKEMPKHVCNTQRVFALVGKDFKISVI